MGALAHRSRSLRQLPNLFSSLRIAAVPVLAVLAWSGLETAFTWVLIPALLTDLVDGLLARLLSLESRLGAVLDSVAASMLLFVSVYGIWTFHPDVILDHPVLCGLAVGLWILENLLSLLRYRRLSSFHTYLSKTVGNLLGLFIAALFVLGFVPWLFYAAVIGSIAASLEELALLAVLARWRANVRGLWWVLREQRSA